MKREMAFISSDETQNMDDFVRVFIFLRRCKWSVCLWSEFKM